MGVNGLPKHVTRQRRDCDLNPGPSAPESSTLTSRVSVANRHCVETTGRIELVLSTEASFHLSHTVL